MSWMSEEWKGQIPPEAISYIKELEGKFETTLKECKDYQLNLGTSENELEKCKQKCDRTLSDNNTLEREVNKLNAELEQLVEKLKGFQTASTNKDNVIFGLQAEIEKSRQELADLKSTNDKILCRTEQLESDQCKSDDKKNNDIEKLKEMKLLNEQRLQGISTLFYDKLNFKVNFGPEVKFFYSVPILPLFYYILFFKGKILGRGASRNRSVLFV